MNVQDQRRLLRLAEPKDMPDIARVHLATRRSAYAQLLPAPVLAKMTEAGVADWWERRLASAPDSNRLLVAVEGAPNGEVLGFAHLGPGEAGLGELYAIHVHPDAQGRGLGVRLLDASVVALQDLEYQRAELWVLEGNRPAQGFYRRHGWHLVEGVRREEDIDGVPVTEVAYWRALSATSSPRPRFMAANATPPPEA